MVGREVSADGELVVFSLAGRGLWKVGSVTGSLQWAGDHLAYLTPGPAGPTASPRLMVLDPVSGEVCPALRSGTSETGALVPVLAPGSGVGDGDLTFGLEPLERSTSGDDVTVVRTVSVR